MWRDSIHKTNATTESSSWQVLEGRIALFSNRHSRLIESAAVKMPYMMASLQTPPINGKYLRDRECSHGLHSLSRVESRIICRSLVHLNASRRLISGWKFLTNDRKTKVKSISESFSGHLHTIASMGESVVGEPAQSYQEDSPMRFFTWPDSKRPRICILGGGFGGLYTALRLESLMWPPDKKPQVLLVDQSDRFVFKPMLYEILSGEVDAWEIAPYFSELLSSTSVLFMKDKVKTICPCNGSGGNGLQTPGNVGAVCLESGMKVEYDWLVLALGAEAKLDVVPGALEFALPFSTLEDAIRLEKQLRALERKKFGKNQSPIHVTVVGSGYCGVELAATIAERLADRGKVQVVNVASTICPSAPVGNREAALKVLLARNVQLLLGYFVSSVSKAYKSKEPQLYEETAVTHTMATRNAEDMFILDLQPAQKGLPHQTVEADLVLWTVGANPQVPSFDSSFRVQPFPINVRGQAEIDETLQVTGHPRIFAVGDSAGLRDSSGRLLPMTAQVAIQQADFAGWNLWAAINNRPLLPFRFQNLGEMMTLGRNDAVCAPTFVDGLILDGRVGNTARKLAYLYRMPTNEQRVKVGLSWLAKSSIDSIADLQSAITQALGR